MHLVLTSHNRLVFIDKVEKNPLQQKNGAPAISVEFDLTNNSKRVLDLDTNTFCSAGAWLGNGTLVHTGGSGPEQGTLHKSGFQSVRLFTPCQDKKCQWVEKANGLTSKRWYPTMVSLSDGRVIILGGSITGTGVNREEINNPTFEFFPRTTNTPEPFPFLKETLPNNLYPIAHLIAGPAGQKRIFVFANNKAIVFDWGTKTIVKRLPNLPGPSRSYPQTGTSVALALRPEENYATQIMICGSTKTFNVTSPAENSCGRINLSNLDTANWAMEDFGGLGRLMPDAVILADGKVMFLNGAGVGVAGFNKANQFTADKPVLTPVLYDHRAAAGKRFTSLANQSIPRMYHSVATLLPSGQVFITGSNPHGSVTTNVKFPTEYRNQLYKPPYFFKGVPIATIKSVGGKTTLNQGAIPVRYNQISIVTVEVAASIGNVFTAALVRFGFVTHSTNMSQRYVVTSVKNTTLISTVDGKSTFKLDVLMPPNGNMIPPGRNYLFINNKGVPGTTAVEVNIQN
jgi:hypothetical protein